jgi:high-affinity iron transporter
MLQIAIVVFREVIEIAIIISILAVATRAVSKRTSWLVLGFLLGVSGAVALAFATDFISSAMNNLGQELFNGAILIITAVMIGYTVIWMKQHSKNIGIKLRNISNKVLSGQKPPKSLAIIVMLATLREGAEIVLFLYSSYLADVPLEQLFLGFTAGLLAGTLVGFATYFGIIKAFGRYFFKITTILLIFLSAGLIASGIGLWQDAEIIVPIVDPIFDLSSILPQKSFFGQILNNLFGYIDQPSASQFIGYFITVIFLTFAIKTIENNQKNS